MDPLDSRLDLSFTYHFDKYSCVASMYTWHIFFAYVVGISGFLCFITRLVPSVMWAHLWLGKIYIFAMLGATATSLLIHNTGLPLGVIYSFVLVFLGILVGWTAITFHQQIMTRKALKLLELSDKKDFQTEFFRLKGQITAAKSFRERLLSLKTLHGLSMLVSRINIVGRIFVTPLRSDFECLTYPVYKQVDSTEFKGLNQPLTQVPVHNPNYNKQPWANREVGWMMMLLWGPVGAGLLFAIVYSWFMTRSLSRSQSETQRLIAVQ